MVENFNIEKLSEDVRRRVSNAVKKLEDERYVFQFTETSDEYVIAIGKKVFHLAKLDPFPHNKAEIPLEEAVRNTITENAEKQGSDT